MTVVKSTSLAFALLIISIPLLLGAKPQQESASSGPVPSATLPTHLVAPLFMEDDKTQSEITVVNALLRPVPATLTLRNVHGDILLTRKLTFSSHEKKVLTLRSLLESADVIASLGSISLDQDPTLIGTALVGQVSMTYYASSTSIHMEEEFAMPSPAGSQTLRSVFSESRQLPIVAVTSLSDKPQTITLTCLDAASPIASSRLLKPHAMVLMQACGQVLPLNADDTLPVRPAIPAKQARSYGVQVDSNAIPGSFAAFGYVKDADAMEGNDFADPASLHSSGTAYSGVPAGRSALLPTADYVPQVTVANFTQTPQIVSVFYASTTEQGDASMKPLSEITIAPMSAKTVPLTDLPSKEDLTNSFLLRATGDSGAVQTRLYAEGGPSLKRVELLGKDEKIGRNGGDHPLVHSKRRHLDLPPVQLHC